MTVKKKAVKKRAVGRPRKNNTRKNALVPEETWTPGMSVAREDSETAESKVYERNPEYGTFQSRAKLLRSLKTIVRDHLLASGDADKLSDSQEVALGEILNKISRIINGDNDKQDSWLDIAGYATLVLKELQGEIV